jgi:hypothetical protein
MPSWKKIVVSGSDARLSSLTVDGSVTASAFVGDGSGLTNLSSNVTPLTFNTLVSDAFDFDDNDDFQPVDSEVKYVIDPVWEVDSNGDYSPRNRTLFGLVSSSMEHWPNYLED